MAVVRNLLSAMKLNSEKARLRFPRLLQIVDRFPATRDEFSQMVCYVNILLIVDFQYKYYYFVILQNTLA